MEKEIKPNLVAFSLSIFLHALIFFMPFFSRAFSVKTYEIVDVLPISFDTVVDSSLVGVRSIRGDREASSSRAATLLPSGRTSKKLNRKGESGREASEVG